MSTLEERYEGSFLDALDLPEGKLVAVTIESIAVSEEADETMFLAPR